jgi:hypothetical protein
VKEVKRLAWQKGKRFLAKVGGEGITTHGLHFFLGF